MLFNFYKNKKILVTGDTGFKGSWLCIWLSKLGADVFGYSLNEPEEEYSNFNLCNVGEKLNRVDGDVRDLDFLKEQFNKFKPDIAFHFAAQSIVLDGIKDPYETYSTNLMGTVNFFEALRDSINKSWNQCNKHKCYLNNNWIRGYRESDKLGGKDPYSASKSASEIISSCFIYFLKLRILQI